MVSILKTQASQGIPLLASLRAQDRPLDSCIAVHPALSSSTSVGASTLPVQHVEHKKSGYKPRLTIIGNDRELMDFAATESSQKLGERLASGGYGINVSGKSSVLTRLIAQGSRENGGAVFGVALRSECIDPQDKFTDFEAYQYDHEQARRLLELGDAFLFLPDANITEADLELLKGINKRIILVGEGSIDDDAVVVVKDLDAAGEYVTEHFSFLEAHDYHSPIYYPALGPRDYYNHILQTENTYDMLYEGMMLSVFPGIFPSNRFRSSKALGKVASEVSNGKVVADVCSGLGSVGFAAHKGGAKYVVLGDINPKAVENANNNMFRLGIDASKMQAYESDLFENIPDELKGKIEVMFFSPPFFKEELTGQEDKLMHAFLANGKEGGVVDRFLSAAKEYLTSDGVIYMTFSNKDEDHLHFLEESFDRYGYKWELELIRNEDAISDTRIYKVTPS